MKEIGLGGVPISWNEVGWTTSGEGGFAITPDDERAAYLQQLAATDLRDCNVISIAPHTWVSEQKDPANPEDWFGIVDPGTGAPYRSALDYRAGIETAEDGDAAPGPCR
jgi:hypothetical protein